MQHLDLDIIKMAKATKIKKMEQEFKGFIQNVAVGEITECPVCKYTSKKNPRGSAKVFSGGTFKCFSCGIWRRVT